MTNPSKKKKLVRRNHINQTSECRNLMNEETEENLSKNKSSSFEEIRIPVGQGAVKKRIRYKQKDSNYKTIYDSDDETYQKNNQSNEISEKLNYQRQKKDERIDCSNSKDSEEIIVDAEILEKVVIPTKSTILSLENLALESPPSTPVTVFVKTTRKLFTPIAGLEQKDLSLESPTSPTSYVENLTTAFKETMEESKIEDNKMPHVTHLPPLPASPTPQRKFKEISPSIRLMMVKYNQKVEQESSGYKSGGSSGSASPVAWRSPVMDRRVKTQTEKYQEDLRKMSPLLERREVQKSASLGLLTSGKKQLTIHKSKSDSSDPCGILKSCSLAVIPKEAKDGSTENNKEAKPILRLTLPLKDVLNESMPSPEERAKKLQKAKEEFLNSSATGSTSAPPYLQSNDDFLKYPVRNRLSQISCGSDTSCDSVECKAILMKSVSAGMINVDPTTYKQFDTTIHSDGYVSLPRANKKHKTNIFNNITSKFRKVKMRRNREPNKMDTVSRLCRQSLVVDINENPEMIQQENRKESLTVPSISGGSSSEDTSTHSSRSGSWIRRANFFKK